MRGVTLGWVVVACLFLWFGDGVAEDGGRALEEVIVVFKTHFDIGYTDLASEVVHRYRTTMIDAALDVMDQGKGLPAERQFAWTVPGWPLAKILEDWEGQTPERRERLREAFKKGRLVVHALPFTLHTESLELEDLVRGFGYSSRLCREMGFELPRDAKMTDVPSHSWVLPTLLKHAGVDFLHVGCNPASSSPDVPLLFWWEGPDGSRVLTMYSAGNYGTGVVPPEDWPYPVWLAMIMTGDNHGPPKPEEVEAVFAEAEKALGPSVKVRLGRMSDFSDALLKHDVDIPAVRGDMPDTWIHGIMSMPRETMIVRVHRPVIAILEALNTLNRAWGVAVEEASESVAEAYANSLRFGEHTWGMDAKRFDHSVYGAEWEQRQREGKYVKLEESWREKGAHAMATVVGPLGLTRGTLGQNLDALGAAVKADGKRIVVFNSLPWRRDGVVTLLTNGHARNQLVDAETGEQAVVEEAGLGGARFTARDVPPMGYRTYVWREGKRKRANDLRLDEAAGTIENEYLKVVVDPARGGIASIVDKRGGAELVDGDSPYAFGQYLYERFSQNEMDRYLAAYDKLNVGWSVADLGHSGLPPADEAPFEARLPHDLELSLRRGELTASATLSGGMSNDFPHAFTLTARLYAGQPYVDLVWMCNKDPEPMPEAGWLCLPFNVGDPSFKLWRLGGIVDPSRDVVRSSNHDVYCLNGGAAIIGTDGAGVGFCPLDSPLVSFERPGLWRFSRDFVPAEPVAFVNVYNNVWGTNFQQWIEGPLTSRVRIWAAQDDDMEADLVAPSQEARSLLAAGVFDGPAGPLPVVQSGLELSRKGVLVTAFGANPDGEGLVLRLWEQAGEGGPCTVTLPSAMKGWTVTPCDLRGRAIGDGTVVETGTFDVQMTGFGPRSFLLDAPGAE